jgi:arginine/lysine/ornithine decarboxylase
LQGARPWRKEQDAVPIADAMRDFWERGMLTFSIPAHNGGRGARREFVEWAGLDAARSDLPMSHGVETRERASRIVSTGTE